jgi:hypothetical protein
MDSAQHPTPVAFAVGSPLAQYNNDDDSHDEVLLDSRGRKHVDTENHADGVYFAQGNLFSRLIVFPMPGKASADILRKFLKDRLPKSLITDAYASVTPIAQVTNEHLPTLQAQLWLNGLEGTSKSPSHVAFMVSARQNLVKDDALLLTRHFGFVVELLQCKFQLWYYDSGLIVTSKSHLRPSEDSYKRL